MRPIKTIIFCLVLAAILIGGLWLSNAPMMPATQKIEQVLPDDRIPH